MNDNSDLANALSLARGDRFAAVRDGLKAHVDEHGCGLRVPAPWQARQLAVLARAARASYVLHIGAGLGYTSLHIASAFGYTGQLDAVEADGAHVRLMQHAVTRHALTDRIRVMEGVAPDVVAPLNGPYDLVVVEGQVAEMGRIYEDLIRLVRIGGSIVASLSSDGAGLPDESPERVWLERLARDERTELSASRDVDLVVAARVR